MRARQCDKARFSVRCLHPTLASFTALPIGDQSFGDIESLRCRRRARGTAYFPRLSATLTLLSNYTGFIREKILGILEGTREQTAVNLEGMATRRR